MKKKHVTVPGIRKLKGKRKIVMLTAYDAPMASILDSCDVDMILVGDSVGTAQLGYATTLPVETRDMCQYIQAVTRGANRALIIGDLPFGSYQISPDRARENAVNFIKSGANAVKIEGHHYAGLIEDLVKSGIPVMGHIGLTPQYVHAFGGYRVQGRNPDARKLLIESARILEDSGVFSMVVEGVPPGLAKEITASVSVPTIGIGAGPGCDGQVLVINDLLGLDPDFQPRFVKQYVDLHSVITDAVTRYCRDVLTEQFPGEEHSYPED